MRSSSMKPLLLRYLKPQSGVTAYQRKETVDGVLYTETQECGWSISASLFRKLQKHSPIKDIFSLPQDQHQPKNGLISIRTKLSGRHKQTESAKGMSSISGYIRSTEPEAWNPRCRHLCITTDQKAISILQLVSGQKSVRLE
ncbi:hypothetical protein AYI70_g11437 [Smittium culicis]|uniref:Uncharacterized protein n=1 Tax=Smittium culicis TaxID=133412 RepID=A0A1R1X1W0_9FUNG|nr:hypothetical protein AYI70_g11437 [Smittium culicis]